jgi:hypothetical protein
MGISSHLIACYLLTLEMENLSTVKHGSPHYTPLFNGIFN